MSSSMYGGKGPTGSMQKGGSTGGDIVPKGYSQGQLQKFTPEQMQLFQQLFSHLSPESFTSKLASGDQSSFDQMEAPAMRQFQGLQGQLASRFSGMGSFGARKSSGFQNTANQAASDFATDVQSRRHDFQRQAIQDLMDMGSELLGQRPTEKFLAEKPQKKKSFWEEFALGMAPGIGEGLSSALVGGF